MPNILLTSRVQIWLGVGEQGIGPDNDAFGSVQGGRKGRPYYGRGIVFIQTFWRKLNKLYRILFAVRDNL